MAQCSARLLGQCSACFFNFAVRFERFYARIDQHGGEVCTMAHPFTVHSSVSGASQQKETKLLGSGDAEPAEDDVNNSWPPAAPTPVTPVTTPHNVTNGSSQFPVPLPTGGDERRLARRLAAKDRRYRARGLRPGPSALPCSRTQACLRSKAFFTNDHPTTLRACQARPSQPS